MLDVVPQSPSYDVANNEPCKFFCKSNLKNETKIIIFVVSDYSDVTIETYRDMIYLLIVWMWFESLIIQAAPIRSLQYKKKAIYVKKDVKFVINIFKIIGRISHNVLERLSWVYKINTWRIEWKFLS